MTALPSATVFAPATIGNVGPGFDVLGLAVEGLGDLVTVTLGDDDPTVTVKGRDAADIPTSPSRNTAAVAARALLDRVGVVRNASVEITKGLPVSGGLGGSAASSIGGALAAALAAGVTVEDDIILQAAATGEELVSGRHFDNLAPCLRGGLTLVRSNDPLDVVSLRIGIELWVTLVSPALRLETKAARAVLPTTLDRHLWVQQMANTAALVHAFGAGDVDLLRRALEDIFAEPRRAEMITHFSRVKAAALLAGALGCSISGAGPTVFALSEDQDTAKRVGKAMSEAFAEVGSSVHVGRIAEHGARAIDKGMSSKFMAQATR